MKTIAIYGKGGIGKSTISSNLSACISAMGNTVAQIGCDPKHDSTQMLCGPVNTLLDILRTRGTDISLSDIVHEGWINTICIEIGGPQPGVGCAGRGIIKGIEIIKRLHVFEQYHVDVCIYDVLGDVVCGGFFEPIRHGGTDEIYIVSSGEFNSLFAANNICAGFLSSVSKSDPVKIGGIIGNLRGLPNEELIIQSFAEHVGVPLLGIVPRSMKIENSTNRSCPLAVSDPKGDITQLFFDISKAILNNKQATGSVTPYSFDALREMQSRYADEQLQSL